MKQMLLAAAALVCVAVCGNQTRADWGGSPGVPMPAMPGYGQPYNMAAPPPSSGADRYGWHPIMRKALWWKKADPCSVGTVQAPPPYGVYGNPMGMPGTLVFPNHQFNRSPRDFFMWER